MAKTTLQLRRGTQGETATFTGALGEVTVDTTRKTLVVHDGSTAGGSALAPLASPTFTGTPAAPTVSTSDNSTKLATTAYVKANIAAISIPSTNTDNVTEGTTNRYFTSARARLSISAGSGISYDNTSGIISAALPTNISSFTNDIGYLTSASIRTEVSAAGSLSYDSGTGVFSYTQAVDSVNAKTGAIVLNTDDISDATRTNKWASATNVRAVLSAGAGLSFSSGAFSLTNTSVTVNSKSLSLLAGGSVTLGTDDVAEGTTNKYFSTTLARAAFTNGTGVTITSGQIAIGQAVGTTDSPTFAGLTVTGDIAIDTSTIKLDSANNRVGIVNSNPAYTLDVGGDVNFTGKLRLSGDVGTTGYILQSQGTIASPTWASISTVLPNITELDEFNLTGGAYVFAPTNNGSAVTITAPIQALIVKNGQTLKPFINTSNTMWFSCISYGDYTTDLNGNIAFSSPPQPGDSISVRVLVGNTANTINKTYPYRAIDIMTGY